MACRILQLLAAQRLTTGKESTGKRTEEELVFIYDICNAEINGAEDEYQWLNNAVQQGDNEDEDSLWIHDAVVDHWGSV